MAVAGPPYDVETFESRRSLGYLVKRVFNQTSPRAEALFADADFTFTQWIVLMAVRDGIANTAAEVARHIGHDPGATTRLIDQLEERGLLERRRSSEDRRVVHLSITPAGKSVAKRLLPRIVDFWNATLKDFSREDFAQLVSLLTRLLAALESQPDIEKARTK
ncbi:MAG: winged helix-turn-helix transcriptional regulator [Alphaproteobacteria bacterium]|nr:winged helix-turn-helix transcriptional regulator [Alphaproteobacteria bacterium]MBL6939390.1 winged helix-turn-helix transcriptional regulator [Alphaproteobacteria bacterium]MBL7097129.1 winged helix-turn-helix transcriptional regulator [Alphaproteobacteria bacterium]